MWWLFLPLSFASECPYYNCTAIPSTLETCVSYQSSSSTYFITPCESDTICPTDFSESDKTCVHNTQTRYPGDYCGYDEECKTKSCKNNKCVGGKTGDACQYVYDCEEGLYCNPFSMVCTSQIEVNQECVDSYGCLNSLVCNLGKCIRYFSLENNGVTDIVNALGFSWACESGYAEENDSGDLVCKTGPKSEGTLPVECNPGDKCKSTDESFTLDCVCGLNSEAQGYCPLFPGDDQVSELINTVKSLVEYNYQCNTYSRFEFSCFMSGSQDTISDYYNYAMLHYLVVEAMYPYIQNNPECVQKTYTKTYTDLQQAEENLDENACPRYLCTDSTTGWQSDQCILYDKDIAHFMEEEELHIKLCPEHYSCPSNRLLNATCTEERPMKYPGDYCHYNTNCTSYVCSDHRCGGGRGLNDYCSNMYECMPGMYCEVESLSCQKTKTENQVCYTSYACDTMLTCNLGVCVKMYSLNTGSKTDVVKGYGYAEACSTGFADKNEVGDYVCTTAPTGSSKAVTCEAGSSCFSTDGKYSRPCVCGYNSDGTAYCPEFEGDTHLQKAIKAFKSLPLVSTECNSFSRNSVECFSNAEDKHYLDTYFEYMTNKTMYQYFPYLQNNPGCVKKVYTKYYWELTKEWEEEDDGDKDDQDETGQYLKYLVGILIVLML